jgi:anti-sigma factor RsiW
MEPARYAHGRLAQPMPTTNDIHEQVAAYALDALDPDERERFEAHLADCKRCASDLAELQETAAVLAWGADGQDPPAGLRRRILESAREEAQVVPFRRRREWVAPALGAVAAAAAVVAIGLGLWAASLSSDLDRERDLRAAEAEALELIAEPNARTVALEGADGSLVVGESGRAALVVCGLDEAPSGETYAAWVITGTPTQAGLFDSAGGCTAVALSRPVTSGATVAVTREPEGPVESPTMDPLFSAKVA